MKRIFILGAIALVSISVFSCTADEYVSSDKKGAADAETIPSDTIKTVYADYGPGDEPIHVPEPK